MNNRYFKLGALAALLFLGLAEPVWSDPQDDSGVVRLGGSALSMEELESLAERGHAEAQFELGYLYEGGLVVDQDYARAAEWYLRAAKQNLAKAQFHLAVLYEIGETVGRDFHKAAEWHRRAADNGYAPAQNGLARLYLRGWGVERDPLQAHMWSSLAVARGLEDANLNRAKAALSLSSEQITRSRELAGIWTENYARIQNQAGASKIN